MSDEKKQPRPLAYRLALWWAYGLATVFALYGAVTVILSFLDRQYSNLAAPVGFLLIGILLAVPAYGFRNREHWGWKGEIAVNGVVIILALLGFRNFSDRVILFTNLVILALAAAALALLFSGSTKRHLLPQR